MLHGKLVLFDIADTEAFCAQIIHRGHHQLGHHQREDLLAYLIATAWEISQRWDPTASTVPFSVWALHILRCRVNDWDRSRYRTTWKTKHKTYTRPRPELVSYDEHRETLEEVAG